MLLVLRHARTETLNPISPLCLMNSLNAILPFRIHFLSQIDLDASTDVAS